MSSPAPEIELTRLSGETWRLSEALAKGPVLLAFFKISCPTCGLTLPYLQRLADRAAAGAPAVMAVSQDDAAKTSKFFEHFRIQLPVVIDKAWDFVASAAFGLQNVPTLVLVEPDGTVSYSGAGFSRADFEMLGKRFGVSPFGPGEDVPEFRPG